MSYGQIGVASHGYNETISKQAYAQDCAAQAVRDASDFDRLGNRAAAMIQRLCTHGDRLQSITDRLCGHEMEKESGVNAPRPVPNGVIALWNTALDEMEARLSRAEAQANRLDRAV